MKTKNNKVEKKLNNIINEMKKSRMTAVENARLKLRIMTSLEKDVFKETPIISPFIQKSPYFFGFSFHSFSKLIPITVIVLVIAIGGVLHASSDSLPGDTLYTIKINIKEKIEEKLTFTPEKKIALRQKRIEDRFTEVEKLIKEKRITPKNLSIAQSEIELERAKIELEIEEINKENPTITEEIKTELDSSINLRKEQIDTQIKEESEIESIEKELANLESLLQEEIKFGEDTPSAPSPLQEEVNKEGQKIPTEGDIKENDIPTTPTKEEANTDSSSSETVPPTSSTSLLDTEI
ncbi:MAG: hypothetical protein WCX79_02690 [Candidatus Paceibacterota bacterium]